MPIAHELPELDPLPPIQMPSASHAPLADRSPVIDRPGDPIDLSFLNTLTAAAQGRRQDPGHDPSRLLSPPTLLRKSISVDSFVNATSTGSRVNRPAPDVEPSRQRGFSVAQAQGSKIDRHSQWSSRSRGASVSSVQEDADSPSFLDSDVERFDPHVPTDRFRHASLKGQDPQRPLVRAGELPLPSRTQGLSAASSMSSVLSSSSTSSPREPHATLRPTSSLQASSRTSQVKKDIGRARSGSLGVYSSPPTQPKRMTINTQVSHLMQTVTFVVVGTAACGKSSVVRKGLANYALSDATTSHAPNNPAIRYTRRLGRIPSESVSDSSLHIVEIDVPSSTTTSPPLPSDLPPLDGVIICYDASSTASFQPVEPLLKGYRAQKLPIIVLACKTDLERQIEPDRALELLQEYDVGLVEVTSTQDSGKGKMRQSFDWLLRAVLRARQTKKGDHRNPASPEYIRSFQSWEASHTTTPTTAAGAAGVSSVPFGGPPSNGRSSVSTASVTPTSPISPTRARSTGDLLYEKERSRIRSAPSEPPPSDSYVVRPRHSSDVRDHSDSPPVTARVPPMVPDVLRQEKPKKDPPQAQWATLDELLDKLCFLSVSGDDPAFISHFLLTYRRFATPRSVLLAMQKRMRQLDNPSGDPMFACFAQMRICYLLEIWIRDYPDDFAVKGTAGALNALIKSIISKTHLLHYGSEFLPFLELLPSKTDKDSSWALKADISTDESDDSYSMMEEEEEINIHHHHNLRPPDSPASSRSAVNETNGSHLRERKSSIPLAKASSAELSPKQHLKDLIKLAQDVLNTDSEEIAQEITRQWVQRFMAIKPRDWLHYTFISSKKSESDKITEFNKVSNHLADWVVSLILCYDRPRQRARQVEKFVDIAHRLRVLNNYSALRAVVAGINSACSPGDETMEILKAKSPEQSKNLQSFDVLLQQIRAHRAYRLALRNSKGSCIPAMEVHMSDLIRANEGNGDVNENDSTKIHWGKFNMMGRFVDTTSQCQTQCRNSNDYEFPERPHIAELFKRKPVMSPELQKARLALLDSDFDESRPHSNTNSKDVVGLRKMFFW